MRETGEKIEKGKGDGSRIEEEREETSDPEASPWPGEREMDSKKLWKKGTENKPLFWVFSALSSLPSLTT